jgi:hypothetical protein
MKKLLLIFILFSIYFNVFAQDYKYDICRNSFTIGVLEGGGSLIGMDYEFMPLSHLGLQAGIGFKGFGGGINYHFKPWARRSFLSLQYWHQGIDKTYVQALIGPSYVYRAEGIFTFQIGIGFLVEKGPNYHAAFNKEIPVMLTYAIGLHFPW